VNEPMPDYILPTERYEDATLAMVWPPLHWAAAIGKHAGMVVKLVKLGARIDALDATHTTGRHTLLPHTLLTQPPNTLVPSARIQHRLVG
jgi:hypothetical protein